MISGVGQEKNIKKIGSKTLTQLASRKVARTREPMRRHALNINVAVAHRRPELE